MTLELRLEDPEGPCGGDDGGRGGSAAGGGGGAVFSLKASGREAHLAGSSKSKAQGHRPGGRSRLETQSLPSPEAPHGKR